MAEEGQQQETEKTEEQKPNGLVDEARQNAPEEEAPVEQDPISHVASEKPEEDKLGEVEDEDETFERPDYFPEKFWDEKEGPDIEALVKSYTEIQKKMSQGKGKAPENYDVNFLKEQQVDIDTDPLVKGSLEWAKTHGLTQEAYEDLAKMFMETGEETVARTNADIASQKKLLGNKADERIGSVMKFADTLRARGVLSDEEVKEFDEMAGTALGVKVIEKIRSYYGEQPIPTTEPTEDLGMSHEEIKGMVADARYGKDPAFTAKVEKLFERAFPGEYKP